MSRRAATAIAILRWAVWPCSLGRITSLTSVRTQGRWLFDQLIAPLLAEIPADSDLILIPDGVLQRLPFATLVLPNRTFLIERQPLAIAPSASVFLHDSSSANILKVLVVAQPTPLGYPALPRARA